MAVRFPDKGKRAAPLAGTARIYQHCKVFTQTLTDALHSDPGYGDGWYQRSDDVRGGLQRHAGLFALHVLSNQFWTEEHWRALGFSSPEDFVIGFLEGYFQPMDPEALLTLAWKWAHGDVSRHTGGDLGAALGRLTAQTTVMPVSTDKFFPPEDCAAEQALIPASTLTVIDDVHGHAALFGLSPDYGPQIDAALGKLLATDL